MLFSASGILVKINTGAFPFTELAKCLQLESWGQPSLGLSPGRVGIPLFVNICVYQGNMKLLMLLDVQFPPQTQASEVFDPNPAVVKLRSPLLETGFGFDQNMYSDNLPLFVHL